LYLNRQIKQLYNQSTNRAATYQSIQARRKQYKVNKAKASEVKFVVPKHHWQPAKKVMRPKPALP